LLDLRGQLERKVTLVLWVQQGQQALLLHLLVLRVQQAHKDCKALLARQALTQLWLAQLAQLALLEHKEPKAFKALLAQLAHRVFKAHKVMLAQLAHKATKAYKA
jgi:hypothetical protein